MANKVVYFLAASLAIFLVLTIVFAALFGVERGKKTNEQAPEPANSDLCLTPYCIKAANNLLESIDENVDPCENFFEFTCGKWLKNNRIPEDAGSQDTFNILRNQLDQHIVDILTSPLPNNTNNIQALHNARRLYDSCVNETAIENEGINTILSLVNDELGGWPILKGSSWDTASYNLTQLLLRLRQYGHSIIFSYGTSTDDKNSSVYFIRVSQSDLGLDQRRHYNDTRRTEAYKSFIKSLASQLTNDTTMIDSDVNDIFEFEKNISMFHYTPEEQRARSNETVRTRIGNLSETFNTSFDFTNYLRQVYSQAGINLNDDDTVSVSELDFLRNASLIIDQASWRLVQNYVVWRFLMSRVANMPKRYRSIRDTFDQTIQGTSSQRLRSVVCGGWVNNNMGFAVSKVYIQQYFDDSARSESLEMINNIRTEFLDMIETSSWMEDESKTKAKEKALAIDEKIGYPDFLGSSNTSDLEKMYQDYIFGESYVSNALKLSAIKANESLKLLREPVDRKGWGLSPPTVVNAFYSPSKNQISFPAGIFQMPFFDKNVPKFLNYGGIGVVIGHEITHGFDDSGRQYDKDGNRIPWWTNATIENFNKRKTCIVDQYSNYTLVQINMTVNGFQTQGENIADNGGIKESFSAYKKWVKSHPNTDKTLPGLKYTTEQLFFINYGQLWCSKMTDETAKTRITSGVHSPGIFRVIGPTSNFDEFDRLFKCTPGQGNSRVDKCAVW